MDIKISIIFILILIFLILGFLYYKKIWIFNNGAIRLNSTDIYGCSTNLEQCSCQIEIEKPGGAIEEKKVSSFDLEKDYYKVKQDLMPYWSNWKQCNAYGLKSRDRIRGEASKYDVYDGRGNISVSTNRNNNAYYTVHSCDLIPCENFGLDQDGNNICKVKSDGYSANTNDDFASNTERCDPIMTFQNNSTIQRSCTDNASSLPLNQVDNTDSSHISDTSDIDNRRRNFRYGYFRTEQGGSGLVNPVLIGYNSNLHNRST